MRSGVLGVELCCVGVGEDGEFEDAEGGAGTFWVEQAGAGAEEVRGGVGLEELGEGLEG